ncbi:S41 family peptidase [Christiangramia fulva]|nr:S41 family peptidase [Christiangramia fulva]
MKKTQFLLLFFLTGFLFTSCSKEDMNDNPVDPNAELSGEKPTDNIDLEIKDFEWKAMNVWYLFQDDKEVLQDDYFANQTELNTWLSTWDTPEDLFYDGLLYDYPNIDRFSWIVDDYTELENEFAGISQSSGMNFGLARLCSGCSEIAGLVRYVVPGSPADLAGIKRGMLFTEVDGQKLTVDNYRTLLYTTLSLTYGFNDLSQGTVGDVNKEIDITKTTVIENPVYIAKTFDLNGKKVGYLMYNNFVHNYDDELNDVFADFKTKGISDLILDLRYNTGGRLTSAVDLGSMINGQLKGKVFLKEKYNSYITQAFTEQFGAESLITKFDDQIYEYDNNSDFPAQPINSLNLNKLYVITSGSTYSASEVLINGLSPYMDVIKVGDTTGGKFQASITLYDTKAPNFQKNSGNLNPDHKYALQPLVSSNTNANGEAYPEGLIPDEAQYESIFTYGILGDENEPLLNTALGLISGNTSRSRLQRDTNKSYRKLPTISESNAQSPTFGKMYVDGLHPKLSLEE